jgi:phage shock protein C
MKPQGEKIHMASFCSTCGKPLAEGSRFCSACGTTVESPYASPFAHTGTGKLERPITDRKLSGVCAAFARAYGWDIVTVRVIAALLAVFVFPLAEIAYLIAWAIIPQQPFAVPATTPATPHYPEHQNPPA